MKYGELKVASARNRRRVGRGISAGQGKTAGRGTKGQNSRAGSSRRPGFEGGQNPLIQRLPKLRGFNSHRTTPDVVTTAQLNKLAKAVVDNKVLAEANLVSSAHSVVKVVLNGELQKKVSVKLQAASSGAVKAIEKAGGSFTAADRLPRPKAIKTPKIAKENQPAAN